MPSGPTPEVPRAFSGWFASATQAEIEAGRAQMADAFAEFVAPGGQERHDLLITHNLVIAEFVRHAFDAPAWRWLGLTQAHCGLTVLKARSGRPVTLVSHNDLAHLPVELRTGLVEPCRSEGIAAPPLLRRGCAARQRCVSRLLDQGDAASRRFANQSVAFGLSLKGSTGTNPLER